MTAGGIDLEAVAVALGEPLADEVLDGRAQLAPVPVPGVEPTVVWRVGGESGAHPWQLYVGAWPDGAVRVLTADQDAWGDLVAATGASIGDEHAARAYVETFLEVTRGALVIVQPVGSLDDLRWRPGSDEEEAARAALLAVSPAVGPAVTATAEGFRVELTLVVDQRLQRNTFDLTRAGEITGTSYRVLADHLPLPIAR
jgi:hypothetical protein